MHAVFRKDTQIEKVQFDEDLMLTLTSLNLITYVECPDYKPRDLYIQFSKNIYVKFLYKPLKFQLDDIFSFVFPPRNVHQLIVRFQLRH